ncbi:hypothetical protein STRAU_1544 [Streptomyces aurantiacus JA 4570]|uniref:Uncharacterized protein n=1 Tax=Streptomyces aurantiacus JA 4570 TaxID=1286094 RepID=S3ZRF7_9ACTN|nr:hypothetical protein [Streptomyces aurantiacus]EPH45399.1 hypothetical protein STRAU_1544 [Streptomyces aurantiacus JA 4570]
MTPESFSARPANSGTGELLDPTALHWGTAEFGTTSHRPAAQAAPGGTSLLTEPGGDDGTEPGGGDAIEELIHAAAVSRSLDDVVHLVTLLEQTPEGLTMAASVLRTAAVVRSVDDVTRLVEELGPPNHPVDHMDDAIRRAAEERPISEVSRLVLLLHRPPHDPHTSAQAVQAAATARSVEDLVQLISRLGDDQAAEAAAARTPDAAMAPLAPDAGSPPPVPVSRPPCSSRRRPGRATSRPCCVCAVWPGWSSCSARWPISRGTGPTPRRSALPRRSAWSPSARPSASPCASPSPPPRPC